MPEVRSAFKRKSSPAEVVQRECKRRASPAFTNSSEKATGSKFSPSTPDQPSHESRRLQRSNSASSEEIAEALLGLGSDQELTSPPSLKRRARRTDQPNAEQVSGMTFKDAPLPKRVSRKKEKAKQCSDKQAHRCKCGKHISEDHPACKSELMLLGERFRAFYQEAASKSSEPVTIDLVETVKSLGAERRRLYDITIVYEAAEVIKKSKTLTYQWCGISHFPALIKELRRQEVESEPVRDPQYDEAQAKPSNSNFGLYYMSRKLMRHLICQEGPVLLTDAATCILDSMKSNKKNRSQSTVERRLYDIGSILETLGLIKRIYMDGRRQPSFQWNAMSFPDSEDLKTVNTENTPHPQIQFESSSLSSFASAPQSESAKSSPSIRSVFTHSLQFPRLQDAPALDLSFPSKTSFDSRRQFGGDELHRPSFGLWESPHGRHSAFHTPSQAAFHKADMHCSAAFGRIEPSFSGFLPSLCPPLTEANLPSWQPLMQSSPSHIYHPELDMANDARLCRPQPIRLVAPHSRSPSAQSDQSSQIELALFQRAQF